jgi:hypothetical protein
LLSTVVVVVDMAVAAEAVAVATHRWVVEVTAADLAAATRRGLEEVDLAVAARRGLEEVDLAAAMRLAMAADSARAVRLGMAAVTP